MKTWIKFCGTTSLDDAMASVEAGANALGFIFAPSKRRVTLEKAQQIIAGLPREVEKIGVFLNAGAKQIRQVVDQVDLSGIQMHGDSDFPPEVYSYLPKDRRDSLRKIKTILIEDSCEITLDVSAAVRGVVDAWLFDSGAGSGKAFDWQAARTQLGERQGTFIIAGGLTVGNVGEAIRTFSPWGVDVVSGIEAEPGHKDLEKMKAFVAAVRKAEKP